MTNGDANPRGPAVDGRDRSAILADARARAPYYTGEDWDPDAGGPGETLLEVFADLAGGVVERLDYVPEKHRAAFVDTLGFDRLPPQPAELPLTVNVSEGAGGNVYVPNGTRALAAETESRPEHTFEFTDGFEATPATLDTCVSVDPRTDHVARHDDVVGGGPKATLFGGPNDQAHVLLFGHPALLTLDGGTAVQVHLDATVDDATLAALDWAYYGETPDRSDVDEAWRPLEPVDVDPAPAGPRVDVPAVADILADHGFELTTTDPDTVEDWLVSTLLARPDDDSTPPHVDQARHPDIVALYADLDDHVRDHYGDYPPTTGAALESTTLTFDIPAPFVETEQHGVDSLWLRASVPPDTSPVRTARLLDATVSNIFLAAGRLTPGSGTIAEPKAEAQEEAYEQAQRMRARANKYVKATFFDEPARNAFLPDDLLANDVPLEVPTAEAGDAILPFGTLPRVQDAFYVGSTEAFTKTGARVTLGYQRADRSPDTSPTPLVSWEYWNGTAWERLDVEDGSDEAFLAATGQVRFPVPDDLEETMVSGHEGHWIRARLVGRGYGEIVVDTPPDEDDTGTWQRLDNIHEPALELVTLTYEQPPDGAGGGVGADGGGSGSGSGAGGGEAAADVPEVGRGMVVARPANCVAVNNLAAATVDPATRFQPFEPVPDDEQALYLGFDGVLEDGPLQTYVDTADFAYPTGFRPQVTWEVSTATGWQRVAGRDGTEGLTESGVVRFSPPTESSARERFGVSRHWLRARATSPDRFVSAPYRRRLAPEGDTGDEDRCGAWLRTNPPGGAAAMAVPRTSLVATNTGLAANVRTVDDERLGSSDGTPGQQFTVSSPPVRDPVVAVDEGETLSAGERTALSEDSSVVVEVVGDPGDPDAVWVRWTEVENFLTSGPTDRHYVVDPVAGTVSFGDGTNGAIPPTGRDNVRISYETGGGATGNVPAGAVGDLEGSLAFVDGVRNPLPGDGGADAEPTSAVLDRAPRALRDRNRAVAPADFERLAKASARKLARARCFPGLDRRGRYRPGWVSVIVVPRSPVRKPVPSATLQSKVTSGLAEHAPATLLGDRGEERLVVRGPTYVEVTVEATLIAGDADSFSRLEAAAGDALAAYLHPLTGGDDGEGWPFGELPCISDAFGVLEGVDHVDHVEDLSLHFETPDASWTTRTGQEPPRVNPDVLVHSGVHDLAVVGGD